MGSNPANRLYTTIPIGRDQNPRVPEEGGGAGGVYRGKGDLDGSARDPGTFYLVRLRCLCRRDEKNRLSDEAD